MRSSSQDLEVFIITYNRWEFLNTTLDSLLYQKDNDFSLTIIDNGSDININQIYTHNERYRIIRFEENDQFGIWEKLPTLTTKKWMMIFHDDDLLHPTYISSAFKILNKFPSVNVIGCYTKSFKTSTHSLNWKLKNSLKHLYLKNEKELAEQYVNGKPIPFCSIIYKTTKYKQIDFNKLHSNFGKVFDRPLVLEISKNGGALILTNHFVHTRIHDNQDSNTLLDLQYSNYLLNLIKLYYNILGSNLMNRYGRTFVKNNYLLFMDLYNWGGRNKLSYKEFIKLGLKNKASSKWAYLLSKIYNLVFNLNLKKRSLKRIIVSIRN